MIPFVPKSASITAVAAPTVVAFTTLAPAVMPSSFVLSAPVSHFFPPVSLISSALRLTDPVLPATADTGADGGTEGDQDEPFQLRTSPLLGVPAATGLPLILETFAFGPRVIEPLES